jgi:hypothetical protein
MELWPSVSTGVGSFVFVLNCVENDRFVVKFENDVRGMLRITRRTLLKFDESCC